LSLIRSDFFFGLISSITPERLNPKRKKINFTKMTSEQKPGISSSQNGTGCSHTHNPRVNNSPHLSSPKTFQQIKVAQKKSNIPDSPLKKNTSYSYFRKEQILKIQITLKASILRTQLW